MKYGDPEWCRMADRRAIIRMARQRLRELDAFLIEARLQRRAPSQRLVFMTKRDALVTPRLKYRTQRDARIW